MQIKCEGFLKTHPTTTSPTQRKPAHSIRSQSVFVSGTIRLRHFGLTGNSDSAEKRLEILFCKLRCPSAMMILFKIFLCLTLSVTLHGEAASDSWSKFDIIPSLPIAIVDSNHTQCRRESVLLLEALKNRTLWAQQMWDASAKVPIGLLSGITTQFGNYDECLAVVRPIRAQYCLVDVTINVPPGHDTVDPYTLYYEPSLSAWDKIYFGGSDTKQRLDRIQMALCVPQSCSIADLEESTNAFLRENNYTTLTVSVGKRSCTQNDSDLYNFTTGDVLYCVIMFTIILIVILATVIDMKLYNYDGHSPPSNPIQCISVYRGIKSLLRKDNPVPDLDMSSIYGIHAITMFLIVLGHRFGGYMSFIMTNYEGVEGMFQNYWFSMWTGHMDLFVDTFFMLSGFLLSIILSYQMENHSINPIKVYIQRYIRLVPVYATIVFFYATLVFKIGDGPLWNTYMKEEEQKCVKYWWANLGFINNYAGGEKMCVLQSWYLACDLQYLIIATPVVFLLNKHRRTGMFVAVTLLGASILAPFLVTYWNEWRAMLWFYKTFWTTVRENYFYLHFYVMSHLRAGSYIVGMLSGFYVYRNKKTKLSEGQTWFLTTVGFLIGFLTYWSGCFFYNPNRPYDLIEASVYAATVHSVWAVGHSCLFVAFILGTKTTLSSLFAWRGFVPAGKLSFGIYLSHNIIQFYSTFTQRSALRIDPLAVISWSITDYVVSALMALFLFLFIETPCRYLFKYYTTSQPPKAELADPVNYSNDKGVNNWTYAFSRR